MKLKTLLLTVLLAIQGCSSVKPEPGKEALMARNRECQTLQKQIADLRGKPLLRTELRRRYDIECNLDALAAPI